MNDCHVNCISKCTEAVLDNIVHNVGIDHKKKKKIILCYAFGLWHWCGYLDSTLYLLRNL